MAYDILPMVVLIGCLIGLMLVVVRKLPQLKALDVNSIPAERELQLKQQLLRSRLQRHGQSMVQFLSRWLGPVLNALRRGLRRLYRRVLELEAGSRQPQETTPPATTPREDLSDRITAARRLHAAGDPRAAEEQLVQVIGLHPGALEAYEALGEVYLGLKENAKAREVYSFLLRRFRQRKTVDHGGAARVAACYHNLATAYLQMSRNAQALQAARKAVALEPSNPRLLDFLLKVSIVVGDKSLAEATWQALRAADPQNAKLDDIRRQIDVLA